MILLIIHTLLPTVAATRWLRCGRLGGRWCTPVWALGLSPVHIGETRAACTRVGRCVSAAAAAAEEGLQGHAAPPWALRLRETTQGRGDRQGQAYLAAPLCDRCWTGSWDTRTPPAASQGTGRQRASTKGARCAHTGTGPLGPEPHGAPLADTAARQPRLRRVPSSSAEGGGAAQAHAGYRLPLRHQGDTRLHLCDHLKRGVDRHQGMPALRALNGKRHLSLVAQNTGPLPPAALPALEPFGCGRCGKVTRAFLDHSIGHFTTS